MSLNKKKTSLKDLSEKLCMTSRLWNLTYPRIICCRLEGIFPLI